MPTMNFLQYVDFARPIVSTLFPSYSFCASGTHVASTSEDRRRTIKSASSSGRDAALERQLHLEKVHACGAGADRMLGLMDQVRP